jgi:YbbR domain-containing protein
MLRWFISNIRTIALAFVLAVVVWVSAVTDSDPDVTQTYPQPIPIEIIGQDTSQIISNDYPTSVNLILRAPRSIWDLMLQNPGDLRAVVDLAGMGPGTHEVPVQIQIAYRPVKVIATNPATLTLVLEPMITRTLKVNVSIVGEPAPGYQSKTLTVTPSEIVVSGPETQVDKVNQVRAIVNINNLRQDFDASVAVAALDDAKRPVEGVTLLPDSVHVIVPIVQQGGYRDLAVKIVTTGQVASGYRLTSITVNPPVVTVYSSNPTQVDNLPGYVETESLNLDGANQNIETRLALVLPAGVSAVGDPTVMVQASVSPIESSVTIANKPVEVVGLAPNLSAHISPQTVDVILSGPLPVLDKLIASDVRVVIDLAGFSAGTHQVVPKVELLVQGIKVESINPATLEVVLSTPLPTPSPTKKP